MIRGFNKRIWSFSVRGAPSSYYRTSRSTFTFVAFHQYFIFPKWSTSSCLSGLLGVVEEVEVRDKADEHKEEHNARADLLIPESEKQIVCESVGSIKMER